jgi:hypothetical protein
MATVSSNIPKYNFERCDKTFVETTFGLSRVENLSVLTDWINSKNAETVNDFEEKILEIARKKASLRINDWNEETLKLSFISTILNLAEFDGKNYSAFADEKIEANFGNLILTGKIDWFVAKGLYKPQTPYLFFHEYKRTKQSSSDPDGQLLAEMVAARFINKQPEETMYGIVVWGKEWYFMTLKNDEYAISKSLDSTVKEDLFDIFKILKSSKTIIEEKLLRGR